MGEIEIIKSINNLFEDRVVQERVHSECIFVENIAETIIVIVDCIWKYKFIVDDNDLMMKFECIQKIANEIVCDTYGLEDVTNSINWPEDKERSDEKTIDREEINMWLKYIE
ncbi:MAG: hypothetical protein PHX08_15570 [Lachnospiraceae bacterium]|nr:hypothetical protein [Lachnospiraceae bacterium]